jgi:RNA polymerase sigma-70 factor (ECF subfamily)
MDNDKLGVDNNFYIRYNPLINKIVKRILNNADQSQDIDDCVNTVFLELMERLQQYNETRGSMAAFVTVITRSVALDYCKGNRNKKSELIGDENIDFLSEPIEFEKEVEFGILVEDIVEKLSEPESVLFTMKYILFYPADEIAKALNIKRNAVDVRVNRLKKKIKNFLAKGEITI